MLQIDQKIKGLPPNLQQEIEDFIEFVIQKRVQKSKEKPSFSWAGALRDLQNRYTSVDLQHKLLKDRIEG